MLVVQTKCYLLCESLVNPQSGLNTAAPSPPVCASIAQYMYASNDMFFIVLLHANLSHTL